MRIKLLAFWLGIKDGWKQPIELTSGLTWEDNEGANEWYDRGANIGQWAGKLIG